ncbi:isochorismate synthase [Longibacter sp.]|jgi:menaquinone-specific isochorismate synthase|uniref:isochorismate synthase n=1 Tax=Longibacter sp. TaxID=2045415 RepID=UPI003EB8F90D
MQKSDLRAVSTTEIDGADAARSALARRIRAAIQGVNGHRTVKRVDVPVRASIDVAAFLRSNELGASVFWSGRGSMTSVAAVGVAEEISSSTVPVDTDRFTEAISPRTADIPDASRYYGGMRFDAHQPAAAAYPDDGWSAFGTYRFVLPRFELVRTGSDTRLACNLVGPADVRQIDEVLDDLADLVLPGADVSHVELSTPIARHDVPTRDNWMSTIRGVLQTIDVETVEKVVMARRASLEHDASLDPYSVLRHLAGATPNCFHFSFAFDGEAAFVGASPERLFFRSNNQVYSEAVAGTRSRARTTTADRALRDELLASEKDRREHAYVEDAIRDTLTHFCTNLDTPDRRTEMRLTGGRHIWTRVQGTLHDQVSTPELLLALHPTPAVGGVPTNEALEEIRRLEGFDRGWYAGPVGWMGRDRAEFAVAIRSARIRNATMDLYSGAGIVRGSRPEAEWDEIEQKIGNFLSLVD